MGLRELDKSASYFQGISKPESSENLSFFRIQLTKVHCPLIFGIVMSAGAAIFLHRCWRREMREFQSLNSFPRTELELVE